jgi:hypothetical protein
LGIGIERELFFMHKLLAILIPVLALISLTGCPSPSVSDTGDLTLTITSATERGVKSILPPADMEVTSYDVSGNGPNGASFTDPNASKTPFITDLVPGSWLITVKGKNAAGTIVGEGSVTVTIIAGQTATASVTVSAIGGSGTMHLFVSWPAGLITPSVTGTLTPAGGSPAALTFTLAGDSLSAAYDSGSSLDVGYYTLSLLLKDGSTTVWGGVEAVRIISGNTTTGSFVLSSSCPPPAGGMLICAAASSNGPIPITLSGQTASLTSGADMTTTATPAISVDSYEWFVDGEAIGQTAATATFGSALPLGNHRVDVIARKGAAISSNGCVFSVLPPDSLTITLTGDDVSLFKLSFDPYGPTTSSPAVQTSPATWILDFSG